MRSWGRLLWRALAGWCVNHELEAFFCRGELGDVVLWMRAPNVLLHGAIALFLKEEDGLVCWSGGAWRARSCQCIARSKGWGSDEMAATYSKAALAT